MAVGRCLKRLLARLGQPQEKLLLSAMPLDQSFPRRSIFSRAFLPNDLMIAHFNPPLAGSFCDKVILLPTQIDEGYIYL